jgi:hypothetical protein
VLRTLSLCFAAGAVGALANSVAAWAAGQGGLTRSLGVAIAPGLTAGFLYPRLVWGGLWGLLFATPWGRGSAIRAGLLLSLAPSLAQLFYFFPHAGRGWLGVELGALTPVVVLVLNAIWGLAAAAWLRAVRG